MIATGKGVADLVTNIPNVSLEKHNERRNRSAPMQVDFTLPAFKLYDFEGRRSSELARLIFKVANVPYEDIIADRMEHWDAVKNGSL
ncbi:unnamed protein product [Gongylonema pulchrum]|uniref:GST N-terminal domain-containing protein n=1 Tax=Gongylonema pulchrum TaxID=637853 RepID=A0A183CVK7_9BILA|nr:unnamed protein product [Gongylonema pulchrum]